MSNTADKGNCTIEKLTEYKDVPFLTDAPPELIDLLKKRFKGCEALAHCTECNFWGFCDCRLTLENKLTYKPQEPSQYIQNKRKKEDREVTIFINSIRGITDRQRGLLFEKSNEIQHQYDVPMMPEIKKLLDTFNPTNNDNDKGTGR